MGLSQLGVEGMFKQCRAGLAALSLATLLTSPLADAAPMVCDSLREEMLSEGLITRTNVATLAETMRSIGAKFGKFSLISPSHDQHTISEVLAVEHLEDGDFRFHEPISGAMNGYDFYRVDRNGDSAEDLVIDRKGGKLNCHQYHVFLRGQEGNLTSVRGPDFRGFEDEASVCIGSGVKVELVRFSERQVFFLLFNDDDDAQAVFIYALNTDGTSDFQCRVKFDGHGGAVVDKQGPKVPDALRKLP
jgi:hypothetical protein